MINKQFFFSAPAEVVRVTKNNLHEVAEWCGGKVAETPSKKDPNKMSPYVWVPTPPRTRLTWAFVGMYVTKRLIVGVDGKITESWQVFRRDYFQANFFETPDAAIKGTWEPHFKEIGQKTVKTAKGPSEIPVNEVKQMAAAMGLTEVPTQQDIDRIDTINPLIVESGHLDHLATEPRGHA